MAWVPGVNKWKKRVFKTCAIKPAFQVAKYTQHCEASPGRRLLVVAISVPPCCESLWTQVQRNWYHGKSIEIITLKNQKREGKKRWRFIHWKEQNCLTLKAFCKWTPMLPRYMPLSKPPASKGGETCASRFKNFTYCATQPKPVVGMLPVCNTTHQGNGNVFKSYACNYKEQYFVLPREK